MAVDVTLAPNRKRPSGQPCCEALVHPDVSTAKADRIAALGKILSDPIRVQLVDVLRKAPDPAPARRPPPQGPRPGLRLRASATLRRLAADPLPPPQEAARGRRGRRR